MATVLVDRNGTIKRIWRGNGWKPDEVIAALTSEQLASLVVQLRNVLR